MKNKAFLELADVKLIAAAAEAEALKNQWAVTMAATYCGSSAWTEHPLSLPILPRPRRTPRLWVVVKARSTRTSSTKAEHPF